MTEDITGDTGDNVFKNPEALKELAVHDSDGRRIGDVEQVYVDDWSRIPQWVTVRTDPAEAAEAFVPLRGAEHLAGALRIAYTRQIVENSPRMNSDQHLGLDQEQELYVYYNLAPPQGEASGAPGVGEQRPTAPLTAGDQVVHEVEELAEEPPADRPRLRRFTATDSDEATGTASGVHGENR